MPGSCSHAAQPPGLPTTWQMILLATRKATVLLRLYRMLMPGSSLSGRERSCRCSARRDETVDSPPLSDTSGTSPHCHAVAHPRLSFLQHTCSSFFALLQSGWPSRLASCHRCGLSLLHQQPSEPDCRRQQQQNRGRKRGDGHLRTRLLVHALRQGCLYSEGAGRQVFRSTGLIEALWLGDGSDWLANCACLGVNGGESPEAGACTVGAAQSRQGCLTPCVCLAGVESTQRQRQGLRQGQGQGADSLTLTSCVRGKSTRRRTTLTLTLTHTHSH